jgi:hypothetical protein
MSHVTCRLVSKHERTSVQIDRVQQPPITTGQLGPKPGQCPLFLWTLLDRQLWCRLLIWTGDISQWLELTMKLLTVPCYFRVIKVLPYTIWWPNLWCSSMAYRSWRVTLMFTSLLKCFFTCVRAVFVLHVCWIVWVLLHAQHTHTYTSIISFEVFVLLARQSRTGSARGNSHCQLLFRVQNG